MLIGEWDTLAAWENHLKSDHFAVLIGSLRLLSSSRSNLTFNLFSRAVGKEALGPNRVTPRPWRRNPRSHINSSRFPLRWK